MAGMRHVCLFATGDACRSRSAGDRIVVRCGASRRSIGWQHRFPVAARFGDRTFERTFGQHAPCNTPRCAARVMQLLKTLQEFSSVLLTSTKVRAAAVRCRLAQRRLPHLGCHFVHPAQRNRIVPCPRLSLRPSLQRVQGAVEELAFEASATDVRLKNALTAVSLLMNTQFIENVSHADGRPVDTIVVRCLTPHACEVTQLLGSAPATTPAIGSCSACLKRKMGPLAPPQPRPQRMRCPRHQLRRSRYWAD